MAIPEDPKELIALFTEQGKLSGEETKLLALAADKGSFPFRSLMEYWKDNHSDMDVKAAAEIVFDALALE